jgi:flagellin-like protein
MDPGFIFLLYLTNVSPLRRKQDRMNILQKRKAVSPVIATVILVAVAITVAVGVSYWMGGISSQYTQFEKVEIQTGYATVDAAGGWDITMTLKNSGSATSTITHVFVNDVPLNSTGYGEAGGIAGMGTDNLGTDMAATGVTIDAGASTTIHIYITDTYASLSSGTTVNIKLHSAGGMDYIKLIRLT